MRANFYPETSSTDTTHIVINKTFADIIALKNPSLVRLLNMGHEVEDYWRNRGF